MDMQAGIIKNKEIEPGAASAAKRLPPLRQLVRKSPLSFDRGRWAFVLFDTTAGFISPAIFIRR